MAARICGELASGKSLASICDKEGMPSIMTVYRWLQAHESFREDYARAREDQADTLADEILKIADEAPQTSVQERGGAEVTVVDSAAIQHQKLRVDARKWIAAKMKPKKYGDKLELDGGVKHEHNLSESAILAMFGVSAIAGPKDAGHTSAPNKDK